MLRTLALLTATQRRTHALWCSEASRHSLSCAQQTRRHAALKPCAQMTSCLGLTSDAHTYAGSGVAFCSIRGNIAMEAVRAPVRFSPGRSVWHRPSHWEGSRRSFAEDTRRFQREWASKSDCVLESIPLYPRANAVVSDGESNFLMFLMSGPALSCPLTRLTLPM
ncbi:hypothetical protein BC628DRAFT_855550 [Trametes gibbosa]|nr:hypothetical protein BC628DRAFT_855550 [Trametes gibbosa]